MSAMSNPTQSESSADPTPANPSVEAPAVRAVDLKKDRFLNGRSALGKRVLLALVRLLTMFASLSLPPWLGSRMAMQRERGSQVRIRSLAGWRRRPHELHAAVPTRSDWRRKLPLLPISSGPT